MTEPIGTLLLGWSASPRATNPASSSAAMASSSVSPTILGTSTWRGPLLTVNEIAEPSSAGAPATGDWSMIRPASTSLLNSGVASPSMKPASVISSCASSAVFPMRSGTGAVWVPISPIRHATPRPAATSAIATRIQTHALLLRLTGGRPRPAEGE